MMDLSDGLAKDLTRLAAASGCGFTLDKSALPISPGCTPAQALTDGEDFEILFTLQAELVPELLDAWPFLDLPLTCIGGLVKSGEGISLTGGWEHFSPPAL